MFSTKRVSNRKMTRVLIALIFKSQSGVFGAAAGRGVWLEDWRERREPLCGE